MVPCGPAHWLWVWTLGSLPQPQAAGQGCSSQERGLFTLPSWPKFPPEPEESPNSEVWPRTYTIRPSSLGPQTQGGPGQDRAGRPGSVWPVGREKDEPQTTLPCGICSLPETAGETHTEASQTLPSGPPWLPRDSWSP